MSATAMLFPTITLGLDLGDQVSRVCALDAAGRIQGETSVRTTPAALRKYFHSRARARVVLEVSTHSPWVSRLLAEQGHEVVVANARQLRLISASDRKTDRTDAETLARLGRVDPQLLRPIRHRGPQAQHDLAQLRARECLVRARTQLINHVRGAVKAVGGRVPRCSAPAFATKAPPFVPDALQPALAPMLALVATLTHQIRTMERTIGEVATARYPETAGLRQIAGVGPLTALCYVLTLEDPGRFERSRSVGAYLGLCPRRRDSGSYQPQLRITKRGDGMLRRYLVNAAHYILGPFGPDCDLRRWGLGLAERGGANAKKRAVVAVARKLATMLHRLWVTGAVYDPLRQAA